ncbi:hypothetical protein K443DRAFT_552192 [Laccaria amethystina LaAM-08-1]|uniref:Uncharacterized protein n=1 Tax=Laccaria amethystina LaAM-08-1 TaxID=1095629 RepID=A0A0C9Y0R7_9AGAR|nr:hypothetical protein K443DRAFT_552192 [Laccaria amethystina LaAM-08-1]
MVNAALTCITWDSQQPNATITATCVEFSWNGQKGIVKAEEVILSGGSVEWCWAPGCLGECGCWLLSCPSSMFRIIGQRLRRLRGHYMILVPTLSKKSAQFLSFVSSGTAYLNGSYLFYLSPSFSAFQQSITSALTPPLPPSSQVDMRLSYKDTRQFTVCRRRVCFRRRGWLSCCLV